MKRIILLCGILAMLLFSAYQPAAAYTCGSTCEDRAEAAVISCLNNGGDESFCFMAAQAIYCQCAWVECGQRGNGCGVILP